MRTLGSSRHRLRVRLKIPYFLAPPARAPHDPRGTARFLGLTVRAKQPIEPIPNSR